MYRREVTWGEMDSMGHVNNVVYNRYAESGRIGWAQKYARFIDPEHAEQWKNLWTPKGEGLLLRKITTEFKFPMVYPDHVTIYHKLVSRPVEGQDNFHLHVIILSELHQRPAARVVEDCVLYDYRKAKKTPLQPFMLKVLQKTWDLQEEAKRRNSERVHSILDRVRKLETDSWDREDAVEDMRSASS
jgi:acyl-CoA thioesterase FadM